MAGGIFCSNCKRPLDEPHDTPHEERRPCPACGSTKWNIVIEVPTATLKLTTFPPEIKIGQITTRTDLLLQAVVTPGPKNLDGTIIAAVLPAWEEIISLLERDPDTAFQITAEKWEEIMAAAYKKAGYEVTLTPRSGDFGRDLIAVKSGYWSVRFIEQVKRYKPGHLVTAEEVRALGHVLQADRNATKGLVSTTSDFAPKIKDDPYIARYLPHRLELVNGPTLLQKLVAIRDGKLKV